MGDHSDQASRWKDRAEEMRRVAETMQPGTARKSLLQAASAWDQMADRAAARPQPTPAPAGPIRRRMTVVTCRCGARYSRKIIAQSERFKDSFACAVCRAPVEYWRSHGATPFKLIGTGDTAKRDSDDASN